MIEAAVGPSNSFHNQKRALKKNPFEYQSGPVVYWMNRDCRMEDNWALIFAQASAEKHNVPLVVIYNLVENFLGGGLRQLAFKIQGLKELIPAFEKKNIPFHIITGEKTAEEIIKFCTQIQAGEIFTDFSPLNISRNWQETILDELTIPFWEVDAHNIVPCFIASPKQEYGAYTLRPKIHKQLPEFLTDFPKVKTQSQTLKIHHQNPDLDQLLANAKGDRSIKPVANFPGGAKAAQKLLKHFLENTLPHYAEERNDPNKSALSNLSPYLHYGHISAQRIALETQRFDANITSQEAFLEELIVRRELADNYCHYNHNYDNIQGLPAWAQKSLNEHRQDEREHLYSLEEFEQAKTHDDLWNAAQTEMVQIGKMHGYMRMYWAKKILEWTQTPEEAQRIAIYLNDKYELDGRDPNGYVGINWSIGGLHDRAWFERDIFGKIRFMSYNGCKSKFNIKTYIEKYSSPIS